MIKGMVFRRETEGEVKEVFNGKVAIFSCPVDALQTETKGTVLLTSADELTKFSKGEEDLMEKVNYFCVCLPEVFVIIKIWKVYYLV